MNDAARNMEELLPRFGLSQFRPGQQQVISSVLEGNDTLCIMPTGGGKSLCYQLPSIANEGLTIVVSPLIALMKDQVDALSRLEIPATLINSSIAPEVQQTRIREMQEGKYQLVYIAPERLRSSSFIRAAERVKVQLLAIDKAHCISQWGHDFRPDYARLGRFRDRLGNPQTIALTATATRLVREDICHVLQLVEPAVFVSGFARDNLALNVEASPSNSFRDSRLVEFLEENPGAGIVYASTRKNCEHVVELLKEQIERPVEYYHAGLSAESRRKVQDRFMSGELPIVVATNAFGMGIDKSDLRFVVHYNLPGSVEAFYQEAGRAGRDGKPSRCLLLYSYQDRMIQQFFIDNSYPSRATVKRVYDHLRGIDCDPIELTLQEVGELAGVSIGTDGISNCENLLEKAGALERLDSRQNMAGIRIATDIPSLVDLCPRDARVQRKVMQAVDRKVGSLRHERVYFLPQQFAASLDMKWDAVSRALRQLNRLDAVDYVPPFRGRALHLLNRLRPFEQLDIDFEELERRKQSEYQKLESMLRLASTHRCRQLEILEYFGDPDQRECGRCDNCRQASRQDSPGAVNSKDQEICLYAVRVVLSGVARSNGRVGKTLIAQMLCGSGSKKVKTAGLSRLSTFGLLQPLRQSDAVEIIDWLIEQAFLQQVETTRFRPIIRLTDSGRSLMSGQLRVDCGGQMNKPLVSRITAALQNRLDESDEQRPGLSDKAPRESNSVDDIESLVDRGEPAAAARVQRIDLAEEENTVKPSFYWTWKLLSDGYSKRQVEQARQINGEMLASHLLMAGENQLSLQPAWLLTSDDIERLQQYLRDQRTDDKTKLVSNLPGCLTTQKLMYYLQLRSQDRV